MVKCVTRLAFIFESRLRFCDTAAIKLSRGVVHWRFSFCRARRQTLRMQQNVFCFASGTPHPHAEERVLHVSSAHVCKFRIVLLSNFPSCCALVLVHAVGSLHRCPCSVSPLSAARLVLGYRFHHDHRTLCKGMASWWRD